MDVTPRVDQLLARAVDEQVSEQRLIREALDRFGDRLTRLEATAAALEEKINPWSDPGAATADLAVRVEERIRKRFDDLETRIGDLGTIVERRVLASVSDQLAEVADGLRKAVGDMGRLLIRDRGRISKVLTEHRNAIIAELRMPTQTEVYDADEYDEDEDYDDDALDLRDDYEADDEPLRRAPNLLRLRLRDRQPRYQS